MRSIPPLAVVFFVLSSAAVAGTVHVPNVPGGIMSVQDGLDAAGTGDNVVIAAGVYQENLTLSAKQNVKITADGNVVIDARPQGDTGTGPALVISNCTAIKITGITFRHAKGLSPNGAGVRVTGSSLLNFADVSVFGCDEEGLHVEASQVTFDGCTVKGCKGGIYVMGSNVKVLNTRVTNDQLRGIGVTGDQVEVDRCTVAAIRAGGGVEITGEHPTVTHCDIAGVMDSPGIITTGSNPTIAKNTVRDGLIGIDVVYGAFGTVEKNEISACSAYGMHTGNASHDLTIRRNVVRGCGDSASAGYYLSGDGMGGHTLDKNVAIDCGGDGFFVSSDNATLTRNRAENCGKDGFDLDAVFVNITLSDNVAKGNQAEGFENGADNTLLTGNVAKKNRTAFANAGTIDPASAGNSFATAGAPAPEID